MISMAAATCGAQLRWRVNEQIQGREGGGQKRGKEEEKEVEGAKEKRGGTEEGKGEKRRKWRRNEAPSGSSSGEWQ